MDGTINPIEWKYAVPTEIFSAGSNTNCDIDFAFMRVLVDRNNKAVYLAFQVIQKTPLQSGNTAVGVRLNIKSGANITCRISGADEFDGSAYSAEKSIVIGTNNDYRIEMRIGYLFGVPENPMLGLQLIDGNGHFSNYYSFPLVTTTVSTTSVSTTKVTTTAKPTTTKAVTTTKPAATKTTTTKPASSTTKPTTGGNTGGTSGSQTNGSSTPNNTGSVNPADSGYDYSNSIPAVEAVTGENGEPVQSGTDGQNSAAVPGGSTDDNLNRDDAADNENGSISIKKQIAAVSAAAILIGLAVYLCVLAAKKKPVPQTEPKKPDETDESALDDDF